MQSRRSSEPISAGAASQCRSSDGEQEQSDKSRQKISQCHGWILRVNARNVSIPLTEYFTNLHRTLVPCGLALDCTLTLNTAVIEDHDLRLARSPFAFP